MSRKLLARPVRESGFTLIEVVIVMVIIAVAAAIVVPNMRAGRTQRQIRHTMQSFVSAIRGATGQAVFNRRRVELRVWPDSGEYALFMKKPRDQGAEADEEESEGFLSRFRRSRDAEEEETDEPDRLGEKLKLPEIGTFGEVTGGRLVVESDAIAYDFFPNGASSGGTIEFRFDTGRTREQSYLLTLNPLVSSISIEVPK